MLLSSFVPYGTSTVARPTLWRRCDPTLCSTKDRSQLLTAKATLLFGRHTTQQRTARNQPVSTQQGSPAQRTNPCPERKLGGNAQPPNTSPSAPLPARSALDTVFTPRSNRRPIKLVSILAAFCTHVQPDFEGVTAVLRRTTAATERFQAKNIRLAAMDRRACERGQARESLTNADRQPRRVRVRRCDLLFAPRRRASFRGCPVEAPVYPGWCGMGPPSADPCLRFRTATLPRRRFGTRS